MRSLLPLAGLFTLSFAPAAGSQESARVCPAVTPARPPMEGKPGFVFVGQHQPCPPPDRTQQDFNVVTDFGDGTVAETPYRTSDNLWILGGEHTYRRAGTYQVVGIATDRETGETMVLRHPIQIRNAPLTALQSKRPTFSTRRTFRRVVARFSDGNRLATARDHRASIRWGDGTQSAGIVVRAGRLGFRIEGAHRYRTASSHRIVVVVRDDRGAALRLRVTTG